MTATDTSIQPSSRVARSEAIVFTELHDTVVMMDVEEGRYYELDPTGATVWALVEPGPTVSEVCEALGADYDVAPETCRDDVSAFLNDLSRLAMVRILQPESVHTRRFTSDEPVASTKKLGRAAEMTPSTKLAWATPSVRVLSMDRTSSNPTHTTYGPEGPFYVPPES